MNVPLFTKKNINNLLPFDVVADEYGNFYVIVAKETNKEGKLTKATLSNIYFDAASHVHHPNVSDDKFKKYEHKPMVHYVQDLVTTHIDHVKKKHHIIYSIQDLKEHGTKLSFVNQLKRPHVKNILS